MKILAAVDGSPFTQHMLTYLAAHNEWVGPQHEYTMLTVVTAVPSRAASVLDKETLKSYYDDGAEEVFKPLRAFVEKHGLKANFVAKVGSAAELIAETAKQGNFDLIVLGSHGHGTLTNLVMGSVATKVLANCGTPALLIR